ncbi:PREDICTED: protein WVD2-like 7 [Ipomoea nil]|uniref:protein WVD2-like 7 n=1 Tax=Ipomoea nil TaxID=35883 RepID=UPI000901941D|nr:PREDICTED: protein WVD2-like 7 [Ipomoea nil]XP_019158066.1 PREDICTED: protein WVD2-like 7 [Ipomoea nil]XP_019158067.1 PREDICTED: protein WVD2-like 7 [Ipomoea nil]XP_019158068.1 PREDICTED: protein WVD2-like 7 [Ipomoea nil]XP_019158069.1 PREDICTED: protein WVD2-like 7 [Ipomoea nil]XP_019158070.1 PREDICTED: protein WVD2-like 7 [Ipomoea nil]
MMSESAASSRAGLEVSVSFGKFESDSSLSWEKWSSFSPNKYLEEVEKCSTPGSVAQKKAYFEAHYKKIAARKVDQLEEPEKLVEEVEPDNSRPEESSKQEAPFEVVENGFGPSNGGERSEAEVQLEPTIICPLDSETANESKDASIAIDIVCNVEEAAKEDSICNEASPEISNGDEIVPRVEEGEETSRKNLEDDVVMVEQKVKADNDSGKSPGKKDKNLKGHNRKIHPSMNDSTSAGTKKKLASPALKSSKVTPSRVSPAPSSKLGSPSLPPTKKANGSSLQKIKNTPVTESKKLAPPRSVVSPQSSTRIQNGGSSLHRSKNNSPVITDNKRVARTSLHMSLSLSPANSAASQNMMRRSVITETGPAKPVESRIAMGRSLIMDRMGDKEIVKRAFKTFRNSFNEMKSSGDKSYSGSGQMTSKGPEQKISTSLTHSGENGRLGKPNQRVTTQKGQSGTKSSSVSSRAPMDAGIERRKMITNKPSIGSTNDGTNEILKKEGAKPKIQRPVK